MPLFNVSYQSRSSLYVFLNARIGAWFVKVRSSSDADRTSWNWNRGRGRRSLYLFTTTSAFNQIQFTDYAIQGVPIVPFVGQGVSEGNSSLVGELGNGFMGIK